MTEQQLNMSAIKSQFVKERVDQRLSDLYETLQLENAKLKIELSENQAKTQILQNKLSISTENYDAIISSQKLAIAQLKAKASQEDQKSEKEEDAEMKESYVEPPNE